MSIEGLLPHAKEALYYRQWRWWLVYSYSTMADLLVVVQGVDHVRETKYFRSFGVLQSCIVRNLTLAGISVTAGCLSHDPDFSDATTLRPFLYHIVQSQPWIKKIEFHTKHRTTLVLESSAQCRSLLVMELEKTLRCHTTEILFKMRATFKPTSLSPLKSTNAT